MREHPPLAALRAFEAVARVGSVVKAAEELHVTHGAVSHQLRALEEYLGIELFARKGKRLRLLEEGRVYALQVRLVLEEIARATRAVLAQPRANELFVGVIPSFGQHWLVPRLPTFSAMYPELRLHLRASLEMEDLHTAQLDIAIRMGAGGWEELHQRRLMNDSLLAVASPHFNGGKLPVKPEDVLACPIIQTAEPWGSWLMAAGLEERPPSGIWMNDSNLVLEAVRLGQGVALSRRSLVDGALRRGELVRVTEIEIPYQYPYWLVWPPRSHGSAKLEAFSRWMADEVARYEANLEAAAT
ncbi:transcriptional regulator GcvA [Andreprevotia chitinilytica]|uniref:transcriptional regulator GcvA n=1 Tax=Andreprevotia chitinilytica TaxID=396808 RepID=UPI00055931D1|nr:transcriptional regulator GcvA [Andreprevotia chitinilytica]